MLVAVVSVSAAVTAHPRLRPSGPPSAAQRRTSSVVEWRWPGLSTTTLPVRAAASYRAGTDAPDRCPRGLPGIGIVRSALGRREVIPAQCRARHAPVEGSLYVLGCGGGHGHGYGCGFGLGSVGPGLLVRLRRPSVARAARSFEEAGRCVTTLLARRRPHSEPEQTYRIVPPRGLPGMTLCGARCVAGGPVPAQCQARHAPVEGSL